MSDRAQKCPRCQAPNPNLVSPNPGPGVQPPRYDNDEVDESHHTVSPMRVVLICLAALGGLAAVLLIVLMTGKIFDGYNGKIAEEKVSEHFYNEDYEELPTDSDDARYQEPAHEERVEPPFLQINTFCQTTYENGLTIMPMRRGAQIHRNLIDLGFEMKSTSEHYDDGGEVVEPWTAIKRVYRKSSSDGITEVIVDNIDKSTDQLWAGVITIHFATDDRKNFFIGSAEKAGFSHSGSTMTGPGRECYWAGADAEISGRTITLYERWEP